jgi:hypothetical protein
MTELVDGISAEQSKLGLTKFEMEFKLYVNQSSGLKALKRKYEGLYHSKLVHLRNSYREKLGDSELGMLAEIQNIISKLGAVCGSSPTIKKRRVA